MADIELGQVNGVTPASSSESRPSVDPTESSSRVSPRPATGDHSDQSALPDNIPVYLRDRPHLHRDNPWQPIILSLDGGGIRGLSSLYILQELMIKIREEEILQDVMGKTKEEEGNSKLIGPQPSGEDEIRQVGAAHLPRDSADSTTSEYPKAWNICHYFDFIVGTSTGGLIAVLLGRLRLDIDTCIDIYEQLGTYIFGHWRWWRKTKYDHLRIEKAVKVVLRNYCTEHHEKGQGQCIGEDPLRQWDFSHLDGNMFSNYSCKVALLAIREGDSKRGEGDKPHLFRSYDHVEAPPRGYNQPEMAELNPGRVQSNPTTIWEACRATSAAPLYFDKMVIGGVRYMDGGVGANNPAEYALNEAHQMIDRTQQPATVAAALISVGTGHKEPQSRFSPFSILKWVQKWITDTQEAHVRVEEKCNRLNIPYFRFDVINGLSKMRLDECKKARAGKKIAELKSKGKKKMKMSETPHANGNAHPVTLTPVESPKTLLFESYQPDRYDYTTYKVIKESTSNYCQTKGGDHKNVVDISAELSKAAKLLVYYRRRREASLGDDWERFSKHPYSRLSRESRSRSES